MAAQFNNLQSIVMELLVQLQGGGGETWQETDQDDPGSESRLEASGKMPRWGGMKKANGRGCFTVDTRAISSRTVVR